MNELTNASSPAAEVYMKHRVWYDALAGYTNRLQSSPDDIRPRARPGQALV